ncbi:MAG TPA: hypothetical protein VK171_12220 [Fimbriimonas sp.]|nr:hypothetical protein [Fimbriimonas sp.]
MAKQVFSYRDAGHWVFPPFLFVLAIVFGFGIEHMPSSTPKEVGDASQEAIKRWVGPALGVALALGGTYLFLKFRNQRVELEGEELRSYDALGRLTCTIRSSEVSRVSEPRTGTSFEIEAAHDSITVDYGLTESATLRLIAEEASIGFTNWKDRYRNLPTPNYKLWARSYYYRKAPFVFYCMVWNGFLVAFLTLSLPTLPRDTSALSVLLLTMFMSPFFAVGIGLILAVLNQRIEVTATNIVWVDMLRRTRVVARHNDIIKVEIKEDKGSDAYHETMRIVTLSGTIVVPSSTRDYDTLKSDIQTFMASRQR